MNFIGYKMVISSMTTKTIPIIFIYILWFCGVTYNGYAQKRIYPIYHKDTLAYKEVYLMSYNDKMTIGELRDINGDWAKLKKVFGTPLDERCRTYQVMVYTQCFFDYPTITLGYTNSAYEVHGRGRPGFHFLGLDITDRNDFLSYKGVKIHPGDPIEKLRPLFPLSYDNRVKPRDPSDADKTYTVRVQIGSRKSKAFYYEYGNMGLIFTYDVTTHIIKSIKFYDSYRI